MVIVRPNFQNYCFHLVSMHFHLCTVFFAFRISQMKKTVWQKEYYQNTNLNYCEYTVFKFCFRFDGGIGHDPIVLNYKKKVYSTY